MAYENGLRINHHKNCIKGKMKQKKLMRVWHGYECEKYWRSYSPSSTWNKLLKKITNKRIRRVHLDEEMDCVVRRNGYKKLNNY